MVCTSCGSENEAGRKFCKECGVPLALACPSCGSTNTSDSKFCGECGALLAATVIAPRVAAEESKVPTTERRLVSVLFADLVGFTTLSDRRRARVRACRRVHLSRRLEGDRVCRGRLPRPEGEGREGARLAGAAGDRPARRRRAPRGAGTPLRGAPRGASARERAAARVRT